MVLSADLSSILKNEGVLYQGLSAAERSVRIAEAKQWIKQSRIAPKTTYGVRLGMTENQVRKLLGKPKKVMWSKKFDSRELIYRRQERKDQHGMYTIWSNYYLFKEGKLYFIELASDLIGGG
ncbi:MAG TPA: hypothetical protein VEX38_03190 [Fimbriimonadaceae bacterium]|nr:hypothetical protein [Fimbriimonadaceae bacterium]